MAADAWTQMNAPDMFDVASVHARWTESRRMVADRFLDAYEQAVGQLAAAQVETARAVAIPGVVTMAEAQADMSRDLAAKCVSASRKLLDRRPLTDPRA